MISQPDKVLPEVFVIGSSTTLLFGPHLKQMLEGVYRYSRKGDEPAQLAQAFADLDVPTGASAGDSSRVLAYLNVLERNPSFRPDVVLMHVGFHDILRDAATSRPRVSLEDFRSNAARIIGWFRQRRIRLVWMTCGPLDDAIHNAKGRAMLRFAADLAAYNEAAIEQAQASGIEVLDLAGFTSRLAPPGELFRDHVHVHDVYSRLQAAFIAGYLMNRLPHS